MGTASRLAIILDQTMLEKNVHLFPVVKQTIKIAPPGTPDSALTPKHGKDVAEELGKRYLLRYLLPWQVSSLTRGTKNQQYVTPTPLAPEETIPWLNLPAPQHPRTFVLLIDPELLPDDYPVRGPRWVYLGGGIEYLLPAGFPMKAVVDVGVGPDTKWELQVT